MKEKEKWRRLKKKFPGLPDEPELECDRKLEKIMEPQTYSKRINKFDLETRKRNIYWDRWIVIRDDVYPKGEEKWLAIGDGRLYNGYYVLNRRDFYMKDEEGVYRVIQWVGETFLPDFPRDQPFPQWADYYEWYYNDTCNCQELDNPGYDSEDNTVPGAYVGSDWSLRSESSSEFDQKSVDRMILKYDNERPYDSDDDSESGVDENEVKQSDSSDDSEIRCVRRTGKRRLVLESDSD